MFMDIRDLLNGELFGGVFDWFKYLEDGQFDVLDI